MTDLPLLPTMGVGSYAQPGWMHLFRRHIRDGLGPRDIEEAFEDATRLAVRDQIEAGMDIISDGELRRQRFVYEMFDRLDGLARSERPRRLGVPGYDMAPRFTAVERVSAPEGLGLREEFRLLQRLAPGKVLKIAFPGPLTFANSIAPGKPYDGDRLALMADISAILQAEVAGLVEIGAVFIQIDEPGLTHLPDGVSLEHGAGEINRVLAGHEAVSAVHVCYGNNASRPVAPRGMARLMPAMTQLRTRMLVLEFANREMAEIELLEELSRQFDIAAGVVDVKSFHEESAEDVAARIRQVLAFTPAEKLWVTADCGFSAIPRFLARIKTEAMAAGAAIVRAEIAGQSG